MKRYTRSGVTESAYLRALKHPTKSWARDLIARFKAQSVTAKKLEKYQRKNLADWTPAERAFAALLRSLRIWYVREHCFNCRNGRDYFIDFYIKKPRIGFEIDGGIHKNQQNYDTARDIALMTDYRMPIVRFTNDEVLYNPERVAQMVLRSIEQLKEKHALKRGE